MDSFDWFFDDFDQDEIGKAKLYKYCQYYSNLLFVL